MRSARGAVSCGNGRSSGDIRPCSRICEEPCTTISVDRGADRHGDRTRAGSHEALTETTLELLDSPDDARAADHDPDAGSVSLIRPSRSFARTNVCERGLASMGWLC